MCCQSKNGKYEALKEVISFYCNHIAALFYTTTHAGDCTSESMMQLSLCSIADSGKKIIHFPFSSLATNDAAKVTQKKVLILQ